VPIITTIDNVPLFDNVQEALDYGATLGLVGYHTHVYNGQLGYMAGTTHGQAATPSSGFEQNVSSNEDNSY